MKTPVEIFNALQAEYGNYGKYVPLEDACMENIGTSGDVAYFAAATTIEQIAEMQAEGFCDDDGYPLASVCYRLTWQPYQEWLDSDDGDECNACDWDSFDVDLYGRFVESV